jgi:GNAT-family acetyltransferase (TIGR03103 family)
MKLGRRFMMHGEPVRDWQEERQHLASLKNWGEPPEELINQGMKQNVVLDCGWGRLVFGQTFPDAATLAKTLDAEMDGRRDVAFYVREPHVVLAAAPQSLFLDPSHSFRLDFHDHDEFVPPASDILVRTVRASDEDEINRLYRAWSMVPLLDGFCTNLAESSPVRLLVAQSASAPDKVTGVVMGVDHRAAFDDPDNGSSLWSLAVDPQAPQPGVGETLVMTLANEFRTAGRGFMDLSVMHDNEQAIALYRKLGFEQVPVYCVKRRNPINEKLYVGPSLEARLNIYARIIVNEARRRGISVEIEDAAAGLFRLTFGGRAIACRESLSDMTSAVAMARCDDKALTRRLLAAAGLSVPAQISAAGEAAAQSFLAQHGRVVVKPARGEQGRAVAVDLREPADMMRAIEQARSISPDVLIEAFADGQDLRVIVIDNDVVAAAIRRPPAVCGDGQHNVEELIDKQSRRRSAATGGESVIPLDDETARCVRAEGYSLTDIPEPGAVFPVRKTANLHSGGTIHDVTAQLHPALAEAAIEAARVLAIPVVGLDLIVADPSGPDYVIIEANERPGLANHEPQPTAERFIDLLFPQTRVDHGPGAAA